jgi:hypothetical protein
VLALLVTVVRAIIAACRSRVGLVTENLALRQQLAVMKRARPRPKLRSVDRAFWILLSHAWSRWAEMLIIACPRLGKRN